MALRQRLEVVAIGELDRVERRRLRIIELVDRVGPVGPVGRRVAATVAQRDREGACGCGGAGRGVSGGDASSRTAGGGHGSAAAAASWPTGLSWQQHNSPVAVRARWWRRGGVRRLEGTPRRGLLALLVHVRHPAGADCGGEVRVLLAAQVLLDARRALEIDLMATRVAWAQTPGERGTAPARSPAAHTSS